MANELTTVQQKAISLKDFLFTEDRKKAFADVIPKWMSVDRLLRVIYSSAIRNPLILECTKESILIAVMQCASLGLEPILGRAWLIPYKNNKKINGEWKKVYELQFQPGYQGLIDLARRSGVINDVYAYIVYENDDFHMSFGTERMIQHIPWYMDKEKKEAGNIMGAYAVWVLKDGSKHFEYMSIHDIYKRRDQSQAYRYAMEHKEDKNAMDTPWVKWEEDQIIKTVIKHSSKLVPASIEFAAAIESDNDVDTGRSQGSSAGFLFGSLEAPSGLIAGEPIDVQFEDLIDRNKLDKDLTNQFVKEAASKFKKDSDEIRAEALDQEANFVKAVKEYIDRKKPASTTTTATTHASGSEATTSSSNTEGSQLSVAQQQIKDLKSPGLMKWEKDHHDDIPLMSPGDKKFFYDKWLTVMKNDYRAKGQPGYEGTSEDQQPQQMTIGEASVQNNNAATTETTTEQQSQESDEGGTEQQQQQQSPPPAMDKVTFHNIIAGYESRIGKPAYVRVMRINYFNEIDDIPPDKYDYMIAAMAQAEQSLRK